MSNFILDLMREDDLKHDPWGTALSWAYACAQNLTIIDEPVEPGLGYSPGLGGAVIESPEDESVQAYIEATEGFWVTKLFNTREERISEVHYATKILDRYLDWCKAAGLDY